MRFEIIGTALSLSALFIFFACGNDGVKKGAASAQTGNISSKSDAANSFQNHISQTSNFDNLINMNLSECSTNGTRTTQKFFGQDAEFLCQNGTWNLQTNIKGIIQNLDRDTLNKILADLKITEKELYTIVDVLRSNESNSPNTEKTASHFSVKCDVQKSSNEWKYEMHMDIAGQSTITTVVYNFKNNVMTRKETTKVNFGTTDLCQKALKNYEQNNEEGIVADTKCDVKGFLTTTTFTESEDFNESTKNEILQEITEMCKDSQVSILTRPNHLPLQFAIKNQVSTT